MDSLGAAGGGRGSPPPDYAPPASEAADEPPRYSTDAADLEHRIVESEAEEELPAYDASTACPGCSSSLSFRRTRERLIAGPRASVGLGYGHHPDCRFSDGEFPGAISLGSGQKRRPGTSALLRAVLATLVLLLFASSLVIALISVVGRSGIWKCNGHRGKTVVPSVAAEPVAEPLDAIFRARFSIHRTTSFNRFAIPDSESDFDADSEDAIDPFDPFPFPLIDTPRDAVVRKIRVWRVLGRPWRISYGHARGMGSTHEDREEMPPPVPTALSDRPQTPFANSEKGEEGETRFAIVRMAGGATLKVPLVPRWKRRAVSVL